MQSVKTYQEKLFYNIQLSDRIPEDNFYRRLKGILDHRTKTKKKEYRASSLLYKVKEKRITVTYYREEYERNNARVYSGLGSRMKKMRQSRVEPVFGTLTQYLGMGKVNVRGIQGANKCMHMSATTYNLKKLLKYITNFSKSGAAMVGHFFNSIIGLLGLKINRYKPV